MRVIRLVRWTREERRVFGELVKWLDLTRRLRLPEPRIKAAVRLARDPDSATEQQLQESIAAWNRVRWLMDNQRRDAARLKHTLPEVAEGIIHRPKQMARCLEEAAEQAIKDIDRAIALVHFALRVLRGEDLCVVDVETGEETQLVTVAPGGDDDGGA